jgi:hypothetical protein
MISSSDDVEIVFEYQAELALARWPLHEPPRGGGHCPPRIFHPPLVPRRLLDTEVLDDLGVDQGARFLSLTTALEPRRRNEGVVLRLQSFFVSLWNFRSVLLRWAALVATITEWVRPRHLRRFQLWPLEEHIHESHSSLNSRQGVEVFHSIPSQYPLNVAAQSYGGPRRHEPLEGVVWASGEVMQTGELQDPWHQGRVTETY